MTALELVRSLTGMVREQLDGRPAPPPEQRELLEELLEKLQELEEKLDDPPDSGGSEETSSLVLGLLQPMTRLLTEIDLESVLDDLDQLL